MHFERGPARATQARLNVNRPQDHARFLRSLAFRTPSQARIIRIHADYFE